LNRPIMVTNSAGEAVWQAVWKPFGEEESITGSLTYDARFPGQWFQIESGLHYNWNRHYDPGTGRYVQPDPLGLAAMLSDGPSVYGYAGQSPLALIDPQGLCIEDLCIGEGVVAIGACASNPACAAMVAGLGVWAGTRYISAPANSASNRDCDCQPLYDKINKVVNELQSRETKLKWPTLSLPPTGKMSVAGHVQQFKNKQDQLRSLLNEANSKGCLAYRSDAWTYATMDSPEPGN
jgi:RHS repeat-associated protein